MVSDILQEGRADILHLIATGEWIAKNQSLLQALKGEISEAGAGDIARFSSLETPPPVIAVLKTAAPQFDPISMVQSWTLALDGVQDPGNLGTIIRTADWFGIRNILCSGDCADCYNPKVVQASMGALLHVNIHYGELAALITSLKADPAYPVLGTFMEGAPVYSIPSGTRGLLVFGNEARGISSGLLSLITSRITIPVSRRDQPHVESLNVASAVAITCALIVHK